MPKLVSVRRQVVLFHFVELVGCALVGCIARGGSDEPTIDNKNNQLSYSSCYENWGVAKWSV